MFTAEFLSTYYKWYDAMIQTVMGTFEQLGRVFSQVALISKGSVVPSVSDVKTSDRFVDLWKRIGI